MKLQKREKLLAAAVGVLLLGVLGRPLVGLVFRPLSNREIEVQNLQVKVDRSRKQAEAAAAAQARLEECRLRSLPADPATALRLYQNWLLEAAGRAGLRQAKVDSTAGRAVKDVFTNLPFNLRARGGLAELTRFLHEFYAAGHLHRIRALSVKPVENSPDLDLSLAIDALSMPRADRKDKLAERPGNRLALAKAEEYQTAIAGRNFFAPYKPPPPPAPPRREEPRREEPPPDPFDASKYAFITGATEDDAGPAVWLRLRTKDESLRLRLGETFEVGSVKGKVVRVEEQEVEIEANGKRRVLRVGQPLTGETPLDATAER